MDAAFSVIPPQAKCLLIVSKVKQSEVNHASALQLDIGRFRSIFIRKH
jgi:hypothetical protein